MPLAYTKRGFLVLRDEDGYTNYTIIFSAVNKEILDLFSDDISLQYILYDIYEPNKTPQPIAYHVSKRNVKILDGDCYLKNPKLFTDRKIDFVDVLMPLLFPELYSNGCERIVFDEFYRSRCKNSPDTIARINSLFRSIIFENYDKYKSILQT